MIKQNWEQILQNQEIRQNLSKIRQELKDDNKLKTFQTIIAGDEQKLISLLASEDAKTRKNTALLMGDLGTQQFLTPIWNAYQNEQQRFVKSSYLSALANFDYREYLEDIKAQLEQLSKIEATMENQKHIMEETRELSALIVQMEGAKSHQFIGWDNEYDVVLLTNRNHTEKVRDKLVMLEPDAKTKIFNAGIMAKVPNLKWVKDIRTYQEMLFIVKGMESCQMSAEIVADTIVKSQLLEFLTTNHEGGVPYYFRVEMKSKVDLKQKSLFVKKVSAQIEKLSNRSLINTTDNYEFEIRLIENKQGNCNILVKLFTLKDKRFSYRQEVIPTSIKPVNAALTIALAKEYLNENAQVLDPFCGVGTMLIERNKAMKTNTVYGLDIQEDAILKARTNTENVGQHIYYINRDFFTFEHQYPFDEVVTNMPFQIGRITPDEVYDIYMQFFKVIPKFLNNGAILVLYSHNKEFMRDIVSKQEFTLLEEYEISRREGTYVFVLKYLSE